MIYQVTKWQLLFTPLISQYCWHCFRPWISKHFSPRNWNNTILWKQIKTNYIIHTIKLSYIIDNEYYHQSLTTNYNKTIYLNASIVFVFKILRHSNFQVLITVGDFRCSSDKFALYFDKIYFVREKYCWQKYVEKKITINFFKFRNCAKNSKFYKNVSTLLLCIYL